MYTEAGGRDLSGNKRTVKQSFNQNLDKSNSTIVRNCKAKFETKNGGDAGDKQKKGKPTYVLRNYKGGKHSKYAPEEEIGMMGSINMQDIDCRNDHNINSEASAVLNEIFPGYEVDR